MLVAAAAIFLAQPNFLVIVIDDIGNDQIGVYAEGDPDYQSTTVHLDALAARGVRFRNFYAMPSCSPTRATFFTGNLPWRHGIGEVIRGNDEEMLGRRETLIPEALAATHRSALIGKWHLGGAAEHPFLEPLMHGFDLFSGLRGNVGNYFERDWTRADLSGGDVITSPYLTETTVKEAISTIAALSPLGPWFVCVSLHAIHGPVHAPPNTLESSRRQQYLDMAESADKGIQQILEAVDLDETVVFVLSDNGGEYEFTAYSGDEPTKGSLREGGVNVPLIVAGAGVRKGEVSEALVSVADLYATIAELARVPVPASNGRDSVSFAGELTGASSFPRSTVVSEEFDRFPDGTLRSFKRMARDSRYKVWIDHLTGAVRWHDLQSSEPGHDGADLRQNPFLNPSAVNRLETLEAQLGSLPWPAPPVQGRERSPSLRVPRSPDR